MIRSLGTELYLAETLMGCLGSFFDGLCQQFLGHKMRAGAGGEIAAIFDKLQAFLVASRDFVNAGGSKMTTSYFSPAEASFGNSSSTLAQRKWTVFSR